MKKIISIILIIGLLFFSGCSGSYNFEENSNNQEVQNDFKIDQSLAYAKDDSVYGNSFMLVYTHHTSYPRGTKLNFNDVSFTEDSGNVCNLISIEKPDTGEKINSGLIEIREGHTVIFKFNCNKDLTEGEVVKGNFNLKYKLDGTIDKTYSEAFSVTVILENN